MALTNEGRLSDHDDLRVVVFEAIYRPILFVIVLVTSILVMNVVAVVVQILVVEVKGLAAPDASDDLLPDAVLPALITVASLAFALVLWQQHRFTPRGLTFH